MRVFNLCPRQASLPCTDVCQGLLNNITVVCSASTPINTPAAILATVAWPCDTPTCPLGTASSVTARAMLLMGLPPTCSSPFTADPASAAPRRGAALAVALAAAAPLLALL